jgi:hypothetical protein
MKTGFTGLIAFKEATRDVLFSSILQNRSPCLVRPRAFSERKPGRLPRKPLPPQGPDERKLVPPDRRAVARLLRSGKLGESVAAFTSMPATSPS